MTAARGSQSSSSRTRALAIRSRASTLDARIATIEAQGGDGTLALRGGHSLEVSNLGKRFFPRTKQTKGDLLRYYARMAPLLLPAIADRPLVLKRFPNGITGDAFYQQRAPADPPRGVRVEAVADEGLTTQRRLIGGDLITLLYVVQLGAISIDPWHSRVGRVTYADYSIIDLDPGPRSNFRHVIDAARWVKEELDALGLRGVLKTSGASGMHVVLPLEPETPNESARLIAEVIATKVAQRHPRATTVHRWVQSRPTSAVYVDFLQNIRGKTVASVYSARAEPLACVSTPLKWSELTDDLDPREFTITTVPRRVKEVGDLWANGMRRCNSLRRLLGDGVRA